MKLIYLPLLLAILATSAIASPGNDGCVGNCSPNGGGTTPTTTAAPTTFNVTPNITPVIAPNITPNISPDIRNTNLNSNSQGQTQGQGQLQGQAAFGGTGIGTGGNAASNATGGNQSQTATGGAQSQTAQGGAGGLGGAGGSSSATSSTSSAATNAGVSQGVVVNNVSTAPDDVKVRTVGNAPDILTTPTAPCRIAVGVSAGVMGGALGFGSSVEDEGCTLRENARLLHNFGEKAAALKLMCNDAKVAAVLEICPKPAAEPKVQGYVAAGS